MDKIKIDNENVYKIEINDNGDCIELDLLDIELPIKFINAGKTLERETKIYNNKVKALENQYKDDVKTYLYKRLDVDRTYCKKMREMFDNWLGEGTSQKVFGSKNRIGMFDEFYNQLVPILNDIQLNFEQIKENLLKRYNPEVKL